MLRWLIHSDGGLWVRIGVGVFIFACLAWVDWRRKRRAATRWREYGVLVLAVGAALIYGVVNDQVTVTISPEYFLYGKELANRIGDAPAERVLRWEAAKVGLKATWSVGLICGVCLLMANNRWGKGGRPQLRNRELVKVLPVILGVAAVLGIVGRVLGYEGYLTRLDSDFGAMVGANLFRPRRFMSCWGVHLGGYVGGAVGTVVGVGRVFNKRWSARFTFCEKPVDL